ncbi:helix-turn-helix domain-containing protein [Actinomadura formosensis]|uniref:helix-turn-helix domain-containing protein n=1 Tax=Actinomadura formosensis TaxID=60706 RepID=UPI0008330AF3|nr:XRE family transcriptional regulator [Actinomadura formosensis]
MSDPRDPVAQEIAEIPGRIRRLRRRHGWTLERLSDATGLSKAYLGRLESGERQPSLAALMSLARAFGVAVSELVGRDEAGGGFVVRGTRVREEHGNGLRFRPLTPPAAGGGLEAMRVTVPAGHKPDQMYEHAGQEWLYVLSGRLSLSLGGGNEVLDPGDAAQFDAQIPHRLAAAGAADTELLLVAAPVAAPLFDSYLRRT